MERKKETGFGKLPYFVYAGLAFNFSCAKVLS